MAPRSATSSASYCYGLTSYPSDRRVVLLCVDWWNARRSESNFRVERNDKFCRDWLKLKSLVINTERATLLFVCLHVCLRFCLRFCCVLLLLLLLLLFFFFFFFPHGFVWNQPILRSVAMAVTCRPNMATILRAFRAEDQSWCSE